MFLLNNIDCGYSLEPHRRVLLFSHYVNTPIQIYRKFHLQKLKNIQIKTLIFFTFLLKTWIVGTKVLLYKSGV